METKIFDPKTVAPVAVSEKKIQAKLEVTPPHDEYEQEADKVADKVSRMPGNTSDNLQMLPTEDEENRIQMQTDEEETLSMQLEEEEKDKIQMSPFNTGGQNIPQVSSELASNLQSTKGQGSLISGSVSQEMGQKIGSDFSNVRVHTDSNSAQMNKELGAKAFTHGNDIYFNSGKYNPENSSGKHLLAHELTHVVQQGGGSLKASREHSRASYGKEKTVQMNSGKTLSRKETSTPVTKSTPKTDTDSMVIEAVATQLYHIFTSDHRPPEATPEIPMKKMSILWDIWRAGTSQDILDGREISIGSDSRLGFLDRAVKNLEPILWSYEQNTGKEGRTYVEKNITPRIEAIRIWCYDQKAYEIVRGSLEKYNKKDLSIKAVAEEQKVLETIRNWNGLIADMLDGLNNTPQKVLKTVFPKLGKNPADTLMQVQGVFDGIQAILTITDPEERKKLFTQRMDSLSEKERYTEIGQWVFKSLEGATATLLPISAGMAKLWGKEAMAKSLLELSGKGLNVFQNIVSALQVAHGIMILCDPKSTGEQKVEAGVEISTGSLGVGSWAVESAVEAGWLAEGGTTATIVGTWAAPLAISITVNWFVAKAILTEGAGVLTAGVVHDLHQAYKYMEEGGDEISHRLLEAQAYYTLAESERLLAAGSSNVVTSKLKGYQMAMQSSLVPLKEIIAKTMNSVVNPGNALTPGHYRAIRKHFNDPGLIAIVKSALDRNAPPEIVFSACTLVLKALIDTFKDYQAVRTDALQQFLESR